MGGIRDRKARRGGKDHTSMLFSILLSLFSVACFLRFLAAAFQFAATCNGKTFIQDPFHSYMQGRRDELMHLRRVSLHLSRATNHARQTRL